MASGSCLQSEEFGPNKLQVIILASEWGSSKGGLSTINRELAIQLAKFPQVQITYFLPKCSEEDKKVALSYGIKICEAKRRPGFDKLVWLTFPPEHLPINFIVGHGVKLGRQAQVIRNSHKCKWIQVVHTDPEELGMFKCYDNPISRGEEKHNVQVELCKMADFVVGVGPKLAEAFRNYLRNCQREEDVIEFTPGIFDEFVSVQQVREEREQFSVLVFGRGDDEDFELKGFDIAASSVAELHDTRLVVVGAPNGKHEQIADRLLEYGIPRQRLRVRGYIESRETLKELFGTMDLVLMPSRTEGFGLAGLEALSAGLPVIVSKNSGFGQALSYAPSGSSFVIDSEDPNVWTAAIQGIWSKNRQTRLNEAKLLRDSYGTKYSWSDQCRDLLEKMNISVNANTLNSLTLPEFSQPGEDRQDEKFPPQDKPWQVGSPQPGSYCVFKYSQLQRVERSFQRDPKPSKGIISQKVLGWHSCQRTITSFYQNPEKFIQKMDTADDLWKERLEQLILLEILPHLEESWCKCSESNKVVYKQLAKLSHSVSSGRVVRHSLQLLLHLICKDNFERGHESLLQLEGIMRSSIFSDEGVFRKDGKCERTLKLLVYSRILSLLLKPEVLHNELLVTDQENHLKSIVEELERHRKQVKYKTKDMHRYSIEFTIKLLSRFCLLKPTESCLPTGGGIESFLEECQEFCGNPQMESKDLTLPQRLRKKKKKISWAELHSILHHLQGKVHSERLTPKMDTERRALTLIRLIVEAFLMGGGGGDWRFCLESSLLLVEIAKNNIIKELRKEAALTLVYLLRDKNVQERLECRAVLEKRASELLLSSDREIREMMINFLFHNQQEAVALPAERHLEHLSSIYKTQTLEINNTIISHSAECFIWEGRFQRKMVAVKVLNVKKNHLLADNPDFKARRRLINEADNMRRLSESQHPNFPVLLGFDTINLPFHIITAFEKWGNLRQFLQLCRYKEQYVQQLDLRKMLIGICRALSRIEALELVHRCVKAENILVGDNFECKLSGLHSLRPLRIFEQSDQGGKWFVVEVSRYTSVVSQRDTYFKERKLSRSTSSLRQSPTQQILRCEYVYMVGNAVIDVLPFALLQT
ncbi:uncharacterized protein [Montipora capricornis]|uniref:uncharacterized protein n=1 Tax=Montipora capricornis TaxID=246305 RepID=UPI0035F11089